MQASCLREHQIKQITKRLSWSKEGWTPKPANEFITSRRMVLLDKEDFESKLTGIPEVDMYREAEDKIQIGGCQEALDELPPYVQYVTRDPYTWYISKNGRLHKVRDLEIQARGDKGIFAPDTGIDNEEIFEDSANYRGASKATTMMLERYSILSPEDDRTEDIMGPVNEDFDFVGEGLLQRVTNIDLTKIPESEDEVKPTYIPCLPSISEDIQDRVDRILESYKIQQEIHSTSEMAESLRIAAEIAIDKEVRVEIENRLDSPWCAFGYKAPKLGWDRIWNIAQDTSFQEASELREYRWRGWIDKITKCQSMNKLFGKLIIENNEARREGGLYGELRTKFEEDKQLLEEWSLEDKFDDTGNMIKEAAFSQARREFVNQLIEEGKDEEIIRKRCWHRFDKTKENLPAVYDKSGRLIKPRKVTQDSWWLQQRSKALQELNFTSKQKASLWGITQIIKKKFSLEDNTELAEKINKAFSSVRTLHSMKVFKEWLNKREMGFTEVYEGKTLVSKVKNYKLTPAVIDRLSIRQTKRIIIAIAKRENHIKERNIFAKYLTQLTENSNPIESNLPEFSVECPYCGAWITGYPKFINTINNKGYIYLICDGIKEEDECNKKVWLTDFNKIAEDPKTLEEWKEWLNNQGEQNA